MILKTHLNKQILQMYIAYKVSQEALQWCFIIYYLYFLPPKTLAVQLPYH